MKKQTKTNDDVVISRSPEFRGVHMNCFCISFNRDAIQLTVMTDLNHDPLERIEQCELFIPPRIAKVLSKFLVEYVATYEERYGSIIEAKNGAND